MLAAPTRGLEDLIYFQTIYLAELDEVIDETELKNIQIETRVATPAPKKLNLGINNKFKVTLHIILMRIDRKFIFCLLLAIKA